MKQKISKGCATIENVVFPNDVNHYHTIFGGTLLSWMDKTAFIASKKYTQNDTVLVSLDNVVFMAPIKVGDIVKISAFVSYVGNTSIEICINVFCHETIIKNAYFTYVNVDKNGKPISVIQPEFDTDKEKEQYNQRLKEKNKQ